MCIHKLLPPPPPYTQNPDSIVLVDITSIMIGLAAFGQWCGLLRFLSYFDKYNMLLITLRLAMPSVVRFGVCAGILYISFLLLGWLVLGPYHPKVVKYTHLYILLIFPKYASFDSQLNAHTLIRVTHFSFTILRVALIMYCGKLSIF